MSADDVDADELGLARRVWIATSPLWKHAKTNLKHKLIAYQAIVKAIVVYGLESAQLNLSHK